jgi:hypothetical protein
MLGGPVVVVVVATVEGGAVLVDDDSDDEDESPLPEHAAANAATAVPIASTRSRPSRTGAVGSGAVRIGAF